MRWKNCPGSSDGHHRPAARARRLRQRMAAAEPISLLEFLYPVLQGYDSVAVRAEWGSGAPTRRSTCTWGVRCSPPTGSHRRSCGPCRCSTGWTGPARCRSPRQPDRDHDPREMYGKTLSIPDELIDSWYGLLLGTKAPADVGPRDAKRALARGLIERFHGARRARRPRPSSTGSSSTARCPNRSKRSSFSANGESCICPRWWPSCSGGRDRKHGASSQQGGVKLDGEPMAADPLDVPAASLDGRVMQLGKRQFRRIKISPAKPLSAGRPLLHCCTRLGEASPAGNSGPCSGPPGALNSIAARRKNALSAGTARRREGKR